MSMVQPTVLTRLRYEKAAEAYLQSLPLEHFMEATPQATQRKITLESLDLVHAARPDIQTFNELLVQYPKADGGIGQVVPDNMVVVHSQPIKAGGSFDTVFQPVGPFWALEYVLQQSRRKDYEVSFEKYEQGLSIPYCLFFYPDSQDLSLYRLREGRYASVLANDRGRHPIPELEMEVALVDGWVRYWFRGRLLPLPAELQRELDEAQRELNEAQRELDETQRVLDGAQRELQAATQRAGAAEQRATSAEQVAATAESRASSAEQRASSAEQQANDERRSRTMAEEELARLRTELARLRP